jgi:hypothetical protein
MMSILNNVERVVLFYSESWVLENMLKPISYKGAKAYLGTNEPSLLIRENSLDMVGLLKATRIIFSSSCSSSLMMEISENSFADFFMSPCIY